MLPPMKSAKNRDAAPQQARSLQLAACSLQPASPAGGPFEHAGQMEKKV
jgi:hypothetical protein